jgi:hypothetical protein
MNKFTKFLTIALFFTVTNQSVIAIGEDHGEIIKEQLLSHGFGSNEQAPIANQQEKAHDAEIPQFPQRPPNLTRTGKDIYSRIENDLMRMRHGLAECDTYNLNCMVELITSRSHDQYGQSDYTPCRVFPDKEKDECNCWIDDYLKALIYSLTHEDTSPAAQEKKALTKRVRAEIAAGQKYHIAKEIEEAKQPRFQAQKLLTKLNKQMLPQCYNNGTTCIESWNCYTCARNPECKKQLKALQAHLENAIQANEESQTPQFTSMCTQLVQIIVATAAADGKETLESYLEAATKDPDFLPYDPKAIDIKTSNRIDKEEETLQ